MSEHQRDLDQALGALGESAPPPPSPALEAMVNAREPVKTRAPWRVLAGMTVASLVVLAIQVHANGVRKDLHDLPADWFYGMSAAWFVAFAIPLAIAFLPRRKSMLADSVRARELAFVVPLAAIAMAVFLRVDVPPATVIPKTTQAAFKSVEWCLINGLEMAVIPFALGLFVLRRAALPIKTRWIGAALGAANGTLAGLMLHIHCWIGGSIHVGFAHAGVAVIGAILGAVVTPVVIDRR
jgi:hypothetical protein